MKTFSMIFILLFLYSIGIAKSPQYASNYLLENSELEIKTSNINGNFIELDRKSIEKFNQDKFKKSLFGRKRKIAINLIEHDLKILEYINNRRNNLIKDIEVMCRPERIFLGLNQEAFDDINNIIKEQKIRLETISKIEGLESFSTQNDSLYKYMNNSLDFNETFVKIIEDGFEKLTKVEQKFLKYYENYYPIKNQINLLEIEIFQREIQLDHDLNNFKNKKYTFIIHR